MRRTASIIVALIALTGCLSRFGAQQSEPLLQNGGFEGGSHRATVFWTPAGGPHDDYEFGEIAPPEGWTAWWLEGFPGADGWLTGRPEVRVITEVPDARRVRSGEQAVLLFTFYRRHDAGFLQQVQVESGMRLRLTAWAHAWSNHNLEGHEDCTDDGYCSCGVGREVIAIAASEIPPLNGDSWNDAVGNFLFSVGIDPTGGVDPRANTVVWSNAWAIYNDYCHQLSVETEARGPTITIFLRSKTLWSFKHNDAVWDDILLLDVTHQVFLPLVRR